MATLETVAALLHALAPSLLVTLASRRGIDWVLATVAIGATVLSTLIDWM
jgi:hypothetical protein